MHHHDATKTGQNSTPLPPSCLMRKASGKPESFFLPDSDGAAAVPYEPCMTGVMVVQGQALHARSSKPYHVGILGQEPRLVFPSLRLVAECCDRKKQEWSLLHKPP